MRVKKRTFAVMLAGALAAAALADCGDPVFSPAYFWMWNGRLDADALCAQLGDDAIRDRILRDFQPNGNYDRFQRPFDKLNHESGLFGPVSLSTCVSRR